jgi:hypothetical protein
MRDPAELAVGVLGQRERLMPRAAADVEHGRRRREMVQEPLEPDEEEAGGEEGLTRRAPGRTAGFRTVGRPERHLPELRPNRF